MDDDLRAMITRIDERTLNIVQKIDGENGIVNRLNAHGDKIRALEHWRFYILGLGSAVAGWLKIDK